MPYEKINNMEIAAGQVWKNITTGDLFIILEHDAKSAICAIVVPEVAKASEYPQLRMPIEKLRSWGNRGFVYERKHKGKLPAVHDTIGTYNVRHVGYGAR